MVLLSILVGLLDGLGLSMFLPLIQLVSDSNSIDPSQMGRLRFIVEFLESINLKLSLTSVLVFLCILFSFKGLVKFLSDGYRVRVRQFFSVKVRSGIVEALNNIAYKVFVTSDVGRIQNTITGEVGRITKAYITYFRSLENIILVIIYVGFAFFAHARFALFVSIGGLLTNVIYARVYNLTRKESFKLTKESHLFQGLIIQHIANFKYLKATGFLEEYGNKIKSSINKIEKTRLKIGIMDAFLTAAREPLLIMIIAVVIVILTSILNNALGPIIISLIFLYRALSSLLVMQSQWNAFLGFSGSVINLKNFKEELELGREKNGTMPFNKFKEKIRLESAFFNYGEKKVLEDINIEIFKNETIAFVGPSGSGKTTIINLLAGLMPLNSGRLEIDGLNRGEINIDDYQKRVGYITQDPVIFNDTIFNNITFWDDPTEENLAHFKKVTKDAAIAEFISLLPDKEQTELGNNGINLSGGQKQRISIARELYKKIDILILDEATSSLDSETEKVIQENINLLKGKYTILIVAHRLSTIKNVDRIYLIKNGQIIAIGSYQKLLEEVEEFKKMVSQQLV